MNKRNLIILFLLLQIKISAQNNPQIDSLIKSHVDNGFNGNIMYSEGDSIIFKKNYGYGTFETKDKLTDSSLFELGSVSKQFTAVAIITLIEANKLKYETEVREIIPDFPYEGMTIEHLLQHRSGLPELYSFAVKFKVWRKNGIATNDDVLAALIKHKPKLSFQSGIDHEYSNFGYLLLASIVEKVSGSTFSEYLKVHLFQPAGMSTSDVILREYSPKVIANNTEGYANIKKGVKATERRSIILSFKDHCFINSKISHNLNGTYGGAGVSSSILEMELWKQALRHNKIITVESKNRMTEILLKSGKIGYGFLVVNTDNGIYYYHPGQWSGYTSQSLYFPDSNLYVVVFSNNDYQKTGEIAGGISDILHRNKPEPLTVV